MTEKDERLLQIHRESMDKEPKISNSVICGGSKDHSAAPSPELQKAFAPYVRKFGEHIETIRIGDFRLTRMATGGIWIGEACGGEGGEFKETAIEGAIAKFYADNF